MFTESSNGSAFYPTCSYPCAGCSASICSSNLEALHGAAAATFQYEAQAASLSTKCNNELNSANLLARRRRHHQEVNPVSGLPYGPSLSAYYAVDPLVVPKFNIENRVITREANNKITKQCDDEIISWWWFNHNNIEEEEEEQINNIQQYNQLKPYSFQQACNGTESTVPVQSTQAVEEHPVHELHSFYLGLEQGAFKAGFIQTPSSRWSSASLPSMDACIVPQATTGSYTNLDSIPQERTIGLFSSSVEIVPPQYCPVTREAKVLRYREKRKARKFEKKIRYSSRKANAETRHRVSGRFARRSEMDLELDQMPSITEQGYAIVPSSIRRDGRNITFGP